MEVSKDDTNDVVRAWSLQKRCHGLFHTPHIWGSKATRAWTPFSPWGIISNLYYVSVQKQYRTSTAWQAKLSWVSNVCAVKCPVFPQLDHAATCTDETLIWTWAFAIPLSMDIIAFKPSSHVLDKGIAQNELCSCSEEVWTSASKNTSKGYETCYDSLVGRARFCVAARFSCLQYWFQLSRRKMVFAY